MPATSEPAPDPFGSPLEPAEVLAEFDGDALAAIAALLHDLDVVARDAARTTSRGYVRGHFFRLRPRRDAGRARRVDR